MSEHDVIETPQLERLLYAAGRIRKWVLKGLLQHSIYCNFHTVPPINRFCNCGLSTLIWALEDIEAVERMFSDE